MDPLIMLVGVGIISISCQLLAYRLKIPAILPLLVSGILLGPVFSVLNPDLLFGDLLFPIISLSVAIILFEGALTLRFQDLGSHGSMVRNLCSVGAIVTWAVITPTAYYVLGISWQMAFLFGAIVTVTGPTVIVPMLRTVRPSAKVANILRWEGIIIDPVGALLAVLVFEFIIASQHPWQHTLEVFGMVLASGFGIGAAVGFFLSWVLRKNWIPHYLANTAVLTIMLGAFALSNSLAHESGLLCVTVMGIWMANTKDLDVSDILEFKETLSVLLISGLFILLAARIDLASIVAIGSGAAILLVVILFVARPLSAYISSIGTDLTWRETALISWIAPRGIVAAAVSSLFALKLETLGFADASLLVPMVFLVIVSTVFIQSLTAKPVAKLLGVTAPSPSGILIFGASSFARAFAKLLKDKGVNVLLADTNWDSIRQARMDNLNTYYGNPISEHARLTLDLSAYGRVLVLSPYKQLNPLVTYHFEDAVGKGKVFGLNHSEQPKTASHKVSEDYAKKLGLFSDNASYSKLASLMAKGATIKSTKLSEEFSFEDYKQEYGSRAMPLCAIDPNGRTYVNDLSSDFVAKADWEVVSLISSE
ncbi:cation:proton antiporter [Reinekea sp.]|uniref:cation:proton antiporter n=1 Tax=Reinekea sp. TaxID=1970455 RepID=UPI003989D464